MSLRDKLDNVQSQSDFISRFALYVFNDIIDNGQLYTEVDENLTKIGDKLGEIVAILENLEAKTRKREPNRF